MTNSVLMPQRLLTKWGATEVANVWFPTSNTGIIITTEEAKDDSTTYTVWIVANKRVSDVWKFDNETSARAMANRVWEFHQSEGTLAIGIYNYGREISAKGISGRLTNWRPQSFM